MFNQKYHHKGEADLAEVQRKPYGDKAVGTEDKACSRVHIQARKP